MDHLNYPDISMYALIKQTAEKYPNYRALEYFGAGISYKRLLKEIDRTAAAFVRMGVKKGDRVSLCMPNIPQAVFAFYGLNKIGAVPNMIHPLSAGEEIKYYLKLSRSKTVVAVGQLREKLETLIPQTEAENVIIAPVEDHMPPVTRLVYRISNRSQKPIAPFMTLWRDFIRTGDGADNADVNVSPEYNGTGNDDGAILYSGGTTGKPKGIMLTNLNFNALALESINGCGCLAAGDRVLSVMPVFHGFGLGVCIHTVLCFGGCAVILPKFSARDFDKLIGKYRPNIIAGVPAIYEAMLRENSLQKTDLSFIKCVISGGDCLPLATKEKMDNFLKAHGCGVQIREGYGLTECVTGTCLNPDDDNRPGSVGLPYADNEYKIIDPASGRELPCGEVGEIILRGPAVMKEYIDEPEETALALRKREDGHTWLYTGDLGYMDKDGYVYFKQRLKRMIVSGGYNIYPVNIENVLNSHKEVVLSAVIGIPDKIMGQRVKAYVTAKTEDTERLKGELLRLCAERISRYSIPKEIEFVNDLPRTLVGKIDYNALEAPGADSDNS
ncbi:MAG: AMP-binding protein [Oscillospiraceae bacterium]|nr:AMP-binding protein [Oscillospiraceae bacterium]